MHAWHHPHDAGDLAHLVFDEKFWDERYLSAPAIWSGDPNPHLVGEASDLAPGTALDVGSGEGADAVWLAARGWRVTATDISGVALQRAAGHAAAAGQDVADRITWLRSDLTAGGPPGTYDLVNAQFMHLPGELRDTLHRRLAAATAPGGTLLVVAHHPSDLDTEAHRPPLPDLYFTPADVAAVLEPDRWEVLVQEARPRPFTTPEGTTITIEDTVLRARRRS